MRASLDKLLDPLPDDRQVPLQLVLVKIEVALDFGLPLSRRLGLAEVIQLLRVLAGEPPGAAGVGTAYRRRFRSLYPASPEPLGVR